MSDLVFYIGMVVLLSAHVLALIHNTRVFWFRKKLNDRIYAVVKINPWLGLILWNEMDTVTYHDQFWKFWKPLASFWPADSRLRATGVIK